MKQEIRKLSRPLGAVETLDPAIRIVLIDAHALFRAGLQLILESSSGMRVVGAACSRAEALRIVDREQPEVVLLDADLEDEKGIDLIPELLDRAREARILLLGASGDPEARRRAVRLGALGVLSKDSAPEVLVKAIERVHAGEVWLDRSLTASVLSEMSRRSDNPEPDSDEARIASLTDREREVIAAVGKGKKNKEIAEDLFISDVTVRHHLTSVYSKLGVADRLELVIFAYRTGLASLPR